MSYDQVGTLYVAVPWVAVGVMYGVLCLYNRIRQPLRENIAMKGITGFRLRRSHASLLHRRRALPAAHLDRDAQDRVMAKIKGMGEAFFGMSEDEYGDWLDALPQVEFIEFIAAMIELDESTQRKTARAA
ncbi:hypothetical protein [Caballeronia sp. dw_19]|uniref:hypothetical protein n=1 Tax=Caballeronia sp. dw_19 TaxID=2719791 RepID=UPI001BD3242D|nr:hypothetical protein [Caballeronia sp. dw_19]